MVPNEERETDLEAGRGVGGRLLEKQTSTSVKI